MDGAADSCAAAPRRAGSGLSDASTAGQSVTTFLLLWVSLFTLLLAWSNRQGWRVLIRRSRKRRSSLQATRTLHEAERRAVMDELQLAVPPTAPVCRLQGEVMIRGWRRPRFVIDDLIVQVPSQLHTAIRRYCQIEVVPNPHEGLPHAVVITVDSQSLLCVCHRELAGMPAPPPPPPSAQLKQLPALFVDATENR